ncbi:sigma-54-dependent sensor transcriptional regulator, PAS domain-containing [Syntrophotalea carbinolica DSM 2380]|uniref:Sigma-54-dependent sensor transcriptional regulator, PAS domain-containing n=1 Tax=Syntrophotalea carbinolica (strain DSM 2380 / NBRC 103641 / GraBd1) TaxID=338963 RepID=Q3A483_SYNC1|nr:sigma-54-dependent Fis family transcriptional regulator [Syntrophotalea carbinolica]ABA88824.1 sigma-54-dependent sensor transcriptional regulator, PAS domain-containing [Syntrophotalea carbinolica DSM 2380]
MNSEKKPGYKIHTMTEAILESISDGVFTVDMDWRVTSFNRAAEEITGVSRQEAIGRRCSEVFRSSLCGTACALRQTMEADEPIIGKSGYIINADGDRIPISISTAVLRDAAGNVIGGAETFRDLSEIEALRQELGGKFRVGDLTSRSPLMQRVFEVLPAIAASPSTVLILGETGTGKELMARTIHSLSPRHKGPFIAVNCGALPDTLLESELFGYKAGAFTGANKDKPGRFALARGGTLFLDEIGEISPALQIRLLRVLQERTYEPLGGIRSENADVRIIVATNKDLSSQVRQGIFREDLYYRVNVVRIELPPLHRRKEDIPFLVEQFIVQFNRLQQRSVKGITAEALSLLMAHDWPGNIRELENIVERAFILCSDGDIGIEHLPKELTGHGAASDAHTDTDIRSAHDILDVQAIRSALERNSFNRLAAAKELGIHKTTLFRKMKKLGIPLPAQDGRANRKKPQ